MAETTSAPTEKNQAPPPLLGGGGPGPPRVMGKVERAKDTRGTILRLWRYLSRRRGALFLATLMVIASTLLDLLGPYLMGVAIDQYIITGDVAGLVHILLWMAAAYVTASISTYFQAYVMAGAAQQAVRDLRNDLFVHLQSLSLRFFDQKAQIGRAHV